MLKLLLTASLALCLPPPQPSTANLKYNEIERYDKGHEDGEGDEDDEDFPNEVELFFSARIFFPTIATNVHR